jgi:hypothetical protein
MDTPDLIIPIRMDSKGATVALTKVSAAGKKAGDDVATGAEKGKKGLEHMGNGAASAARSMFALSAAQAGLSAVNKVATAIGDEFKRAADYVKSLAVDFAELRKTMQELAALKGEPNSNKFTVREAERGAQYGMTPAQNRSAQEEFMNFTGVNVGDELDAAGNPTGKTAKGAKLTTKQGEEFSGRIAALMKTAGIAPEIGMSLGGAILQQAKGPQDVNKLMRNFQETFAIGQKGPVKLAEMIPHLQRIMADNISVQDAAKMFNIVAPAAGKGEEGTAVEGALRAIQEMKNENKGREFGVERGMTDMEAVRSFAANIEARKQKMVAGGMNPEKAKDELQALLASQDIAKDVREACGLVRGFADQGVEREGFLQYDEIHRNLPADFEQRAVKEYRDSDQGKRDAETVRQSVARVVRGEKTQDVELELEKTRSEIIESGRAEKTTPENALRSGFSVVNRVDLEQQLVNERALRNVGRRAAAAGVETPFDDRTALGRANIATESLANQLQINKDIRHLLEQINRKMPDKTTDPGKSLESKMPSPDGRGSRMT